MSFLLERVHGLGGGMSLTGITVAWMGSERDWQRGLTGWLSAACAGGGTSCCLLGAGWMHWEEAECAPGPSPEVSLGAAAYFLKGRGKEPPCIPSPHCPHLHINVLSLVG